jgi:hypothetical protein
MDSNVELLSATLYVYLFIFDISSNNIYFVIVNTVLSHFKFFYSNFFLHFSDVACKFSGQVAYLFTQWFT